MWTHRRSGQNNRRNAHDHREPYERDRTRVIHCPSFRRLQRKTQILGTDRGDFHRTRLTHSLEVSSISCSIVRNLTQNDLTKQWTGLLPNDDLITSISLLHDIGHPPFGHGGEVALNFMMHDYGGFESNGQTLRLLTKLENSYGQYGLDLTRRCLLGILKYPINRQRLLAPEAPQESNLDTKSALHQKAIRINDWLPPKAYFDSEQDEIDWLLSAFTAQDRDLFQSLQRPPQGHQHGLSAYHGFDCSIMNTADDIAYGVHDLEDAIHLHLITREQVDHTEFRHLLNSTGLADTNYRLIDLLFANDIQQRKQAIGEIVNYLITSIQIINTNDQFNDTLLKHNLSLQTEAHALLHYLKDTIYRYVINSQAARTAEYCGQRVILNLFAAISSNPSALLDPKSRQYYQQAQDESAAYRVICDYIANMTDECAFRMNEQLFGYRNQSYL